MCGRGNNLNEEGGCREKGRQGKTKVPSVVIDGRGLSSSSWTPVLRVVVRLPADGLAVVFWGLHVAESH